MKNRLWIIAFMAFLILPVGAGYVYRTANPDEDRRQISLGDWLSADLLAFGFGIGHAGTHPGADHGKLQFAEDAGHLQEGHAHGVDLPTTAVDAHAVQDDQSQMFFFDGIQDFA